MLHTMKLKKEPFEKIKNGSKTIELRLYDEKRQCRSVILLNSHAWMMRS